MSKMNQDELLAFLQDNPGEEYTLFDIAMELGQMEPEWVMAVTGDLEYMLGEDYGMNKAGYEACKAYVKDKLGLEDEGEWFM
jgi:hypothetical protein